MNPVKFNLKVAPRNLEQSENQEELDMTAHLRAGKHDEQDAGPIVHQVRYRG